MISAISFPFKLQLSETSLLATGKVYLGCTAWYRAATFKHDVMT